MSQTTRHILLIEPAEFYMNPETAETNIFQHDEHEPHIATYEHALHEFRRFRDCLVKHGVQVTTLRGKIGCPDHIFPNWVSTSPDGTAVFYPMLNSNRQAERTADMLDFFRKYYDVAADFTSEERKGRYLESTGSLVIDHVNRIAYAALSARTTESLAIEWGKKLGYKLICFPTMSDAGKPIYHTDLTMFIGEKFAAVCADCISDPDKKKEVIESLSAYRDVIFLTREQLANFCGNSLEVKGTDNRPYLVMSENGQKHLTDEQKHKFLNYVTDIIGTDIHTIETYGGGSARCLMLELH